MSGLVRVDVVNRRLAVNRSLRPVPECVPNSLSPAESYHLLYKLTTPPTLAELFWLSTATLQNRKGPTPAYR